MENILRNLKDPTWWFNFVVFWFLIVIFGPLVYKLFWKLLSLVSIRVRERRARKEQTIQREVDLILADPNSLILHSLVTVTSGVIVLILIIFAWMSHSYYTYILVGLNNVPLFFVAKYVAIYTAIGCLLAVFPVFLFFFNLMKISFLAYLTYRKKEKHLRFTSEASTNSQSDNKTS